MRQFTLFTALALTLAGCAQQASPEPAVGCTHIVDLPHATVGISQHNAVTSLRPGVEGVTVTWAATINGVTEHGGDNVWSWSDHGTDTIGLGCADDLQVVETSYVLGTSK